MPQLTTLLKSNHLELSRRVRRAHSTFLKRTMGIDMLAQLAEAQHALNLLRHSTTTLVQRKKLDG